jgi:hypothetical protein
VVAGGRRGKDDRNQNTLAPLTVTLGTSKDDHAFFCRPILFTAYKGAGRKTKREKGREPVALC